MKANELKRGMAFQQDAQTVSGETGDCANGIVP